MKSLFLCLLMTSIAAGGVPRLAGRRRCADCCSIAARSAAALRAPRSTASASRGRLSGFVVQHQARQQRERRAAALAGAHQNADRRLPGAAVNRQHRDRRRSGRRARPAPRPARRRARSASACRPNAAAGRGADPVARARRRRAACAARRPGSGETFCRAGSLNGGFISTRSAEPGRCRARRIRRAGAVTSSVDDAHPLDRGRCARRSRPRCAASSGSISTSVTSTSGTRTASASPAAPTPAPNSTTRSPARARGRGRQQDRVVADAVAALLLLQPQPAAQHGIVGRLRLAAPLGSRPQLVGEPGVLQQLPRGLPMLVIDQDAARQHAERAFQHAHVLVEHHVRNVGALEQRLDRGDQHRIVGADEFAQRISAPPPLFGRRALRQIGQQLRSRAGRASPCRGSGRRRSTGTPAASGRSTAPRSAAAAPVPSCR